MALLAEAEISSPPVPSNSRFSSEPRPLFSVFCCQGVHGSVAPWALGTAATAAARTDAAARMRTAASLQVTQHARDAERVDDDRRGLFAFCASLLDLAFR